MNEQLTQVEQDKLAINPDFDFKNDIARRPPDQLSPGELSMFKWSGIYQQPQEGFFMLRVRVPGGRITAAQLDRAADLAAQLARGMLTLTTRSTLQFHWVRREDLWKILEGMKEAGLDTKNACGDVTRNVVTCPLQGICPHEIKDVRPMLLTIANDPELRDRQRNLPRKHKISVSGCGRACGQTLMNCQGWHPVVRRGADGGEETGWKWHAGGGLGARPCMAKAVFDWVPEDLVPDVTRATVEIHRQRGNRRSRALARLKIIVDELGVEKFADLVFEELRQRGAKGIERIERSAGPAAVAPAFVDGQAVVPQRQPGLHVVRLMVARGELSFGSARLLAGWAREYGDGSLQLTARQNVEIPGVPAGGVEALRAAAARGGFGIDGFERLPDVVACAGTTLCRLAATNAPAAYRLLHEAFVQDREYWERVGPVRIHVNACPNSCAHHWVADIGLRGLRRKGGAGIEEAYEVCLGGSLAGAGRIAQAVCVVPAGDVVTVVRRIIDAYLSRRSGAEETFGECVRRLGAGAFAG
ncbi:nitrite/sulfite reductase [bacterium]|nr:nitrite/sulfite reductase [bacterium]